jgi:cytochrome d ubiquinol oxidase subunit II
MHSYLADVWFYLLGLILALYVMLDGFDLGVGIISLFTSKESRKSILMSSLSAVWDANEVWLVIWGGALFGAFPLAYSTVMNALYLPVILLLISLIFRGISFEFRQLSSNKRIWSFSFGAGSLLAAIAQGTILGGTLTGIKVDSSGNFAGLLFDWVHGTTVIVILEVIAGYILLGSTYLIMKTTGIVQKHNRSVALFAACVVFLFALYTAFFVPLTGNALIIALLRGPHTPYLFALLGLSGILFALLIYSLIKQNERLPFILSLLIFLFTFGGLWSATYPYLLPGAVSVDMAASRPNTLLFMLVGIGPIIPIIMVYNFYVYKVFRHKVGDESEKDTNNF